jgi:hypothetical protein
MVMTLPAARARATLADIATVTESALAVKFSTRGRHVAGSGREYAAPHALDDDTTARLPPQRVRARTTKEPTAPSLQAAVVPLRDTSPTNSSDATDASWHAEVPAGHRNVLP